MVTVEFAIGLAEGKFKASAIVPAGQTNLTQILPVIQSLEDSLIEGVSAQLAEAGKPVSCKVGCAHCCRQLVALNLFEAEALAAWIQTLPESRRQHLAERFHQTLLKISAAGLLERMVNEDWIVESNTAEKLALDYLYQRIDCPFLEDEQCSIYPMRPLLCREYMVTSAPEHCIDPAAGQNEPVRLPLLFSLSMQSIASELESDSRGWIPLLFLFAWMKAGAHPGEAVAGTGPEVLYEFVRRLDSARLHSPAPEPTRGASPQPTNTPEI
jgi:Fe-S-cluster containining protein